MAAWPERAERRRSPGRVLALVASAALSLPLGGLRDAGALDAETWGDFSDLDRFFEEQLERLRIPGGAVAIVRHDRPLHVRGFGRADPEGRAVTGTTAFVLGSTTKPFTALVIMQLVETGHVGLDAPVRTYLPWFRVADEEASSRITIRHLLTHTSGLAEREGRLGLADGRTDPEAITRHARGLRTARLAHRVGTACEYSNANYVALGAVIEEVAGRTYEEYIAEHVFVPLQMSHSFASPRLAEGREAAVGFRQWFGFPVAAPDMPFVRGVLPAGYLVSSAEDLARFLIAHLNEGRYGAAAVLSPEGVAVLHRPAARLSDELSYAMGWLVENRHGRQILWHNGATPSFYSHLALAPAEGWGLAVLLNASHIFATGQLDGLARSLFDALIRGDSPVAVTARLHPVILVIYALALALLATQLLWIAFSFIRSRRAHRSIGAEARRPTSLGRRMVVVALNIALAVAVVGGYRWLSGTPLTVAALYAPDLTWVVLTIGLIATAQAFAHAVRRATARHPPRLAAR